MGWQQALYKHFFDPQHKGPLRVLLDRLFLTLIAANLLVLMPMTLDASFRQYGQTVQQLNLISYAIFALEYLLRLLSAAGNPRYSGKGMPLMREVFSLSGIADLLVFLPFVAGLGHLDLRVLKLVRGWQIWGLSGALTDAYTEFRTATQGQSLRRKMYVLLYAVPGVTRLHHYVDDFLVSTVLLSVVMIILESVPSIEHKLHAEFVLIDAITVAIFSLEYMLRLYAIPENPNYASDISGRLRYMKSGSALIDLIAVAPFYLELLLGQLFDLRFMRIFRLLRLLKLTRYTASLSSLGKVIARESGILGAAGFLMLLLVLLAASLGYLFEHEAQPDKFENIPQSIYWAVITLASVGYGDISPITPMGRFMTIILAVVGVGIFALPAGVLASAFSDQLHMERQRFQQMVSEALSDGILTEEEKAMIESESKRVHLEPADVQRLMQTMAHGRGQAFDRHKRPDRPAEVAQGAAAEDAASALVSWQNNPELAFAQINQFLSNAQLVMVASDVARLEKLFNDPALASDNQRQLFAKLLELQRTV